MENSVRRSVLWSVQMHSSCKVEKEKEMAAISHLPRDKSSS